MSSELSQSKPAVQEPALSSQPPPAKEVRRERRAFRRRTVRAKVRIQTDPLGMAPFLEVSPLNFSEGGICFITPKELTPGKVITIDIQRPTSGKQFKSEAEIRWIKAIAENKFHVGCQWKRRLNFTEIQDFM